MYGPGSPTVSVSHGKDLEFCSSFIHKVGRSCSILTIVAWSIAGETLAFSISWTLKDFSGKDYRQHHGLDKLAHESKGEQSQNRFSLPYNFSGHSHSVPQIRWPCFIQIGWSRNALTRVSRSNRVDNQDLSALRFSQKST